MISQFSRLLIVILPCCPILKRVRPLRLGTLGISPLGCGFSWFHQYFATNTVLKQLWVLQMEGRWWYTTGGRPCSDSSFALCWGRRGHLVSYLKSFKWGVWQSSNITSRRKTTTINPDLPKDFTGRPKCLCSLLGLNSEIWNLLQQRPLHFSIRSSCEKITNKLSPCLCFLSLATLDPVASKPCATGVPSNHDGPMAWLVSHARLPVIQNVKGKYFASSFGSFRIKRIKLIPILTVWKCHKFNKVNMFFLYL